MINNPEINEFGHWEKSNPISKFLNEKCLRPLLGLPNMFLEIL